MARGQNAQPVVPATPVAPVVNKTVLRPRINDVAYDVAFSVPDGLYSITLLSISYKDGSKKDANGKLMVVEHPYEGMPNLRAWLMLKAVDEQGAVYQLCQEYAKANGANFENVLEDEDETIVKTGAKLMVIDGKFTYTM